MTISGNNNKSIKDWIRPLQKSLTIETENKFINTLGREKYFNDYLHESLKKLDNLNLSEEYLRIFYEFSKKYNEYNKLDENQRKRLIVDTRKNLYKLGKNLLDRFLSFRAVLFFSFRASGQSMFLLC